jgi:hypothetical protein
VIVEISTYTISYVYDVRTLITSLCGGLMIWELLEVPRAPSLPFWYLFVPVLSDVYAYRLSPDPDAYASCRFGLLHSVE